MIITGGFEGERVLDSIDIFDPAPGVISLSGRLSSPRANCTATTLSGGKVWIVGGTDGSHVLASAELVDPATDGVQAVGNLAAPPAGRDRVRVAAGTAEDQPVNSAEFFDPLRNTFEAAPETPAENRTGLTVTIGVLNPDASIRAAKTTRFPE